MLQLTFAAQTCFVKQTWTIVGVSMILVRQVYLLRQTSDMMEIPSSYTAEEDATICEKGFREPREILFDRTILAVLSALPLRRRARAFSLQAATASSWMATSIGRNTAYY